MDPASFLEALRERFRSVVSEGRRRYTVVILVYDHAVEAPEPKIISNAATTSSLRGILVHVLRGLQTHDYRPATARDAWPPDFPPERKPS